MYIFSKNRPGSNKYDGFILRHVVLKKISAQVQSASVSINKIIDMFI